MPRRLPPVKQALLNNNSASDPVDEHEEDLYLFDTSSRKAGQVLRALSLLLLSLLTVLCTIFAFTYNGRWDMFGGRMRLVSVSILHTHGAKSSDFRQAWETEQWKEGYGELTVAGMQQMYHLGQQFRDRYVDMFNLLPKQARTAQRFVTARSVEIDRSQESAMSLLMGLFDETGEALPTAPEHCPCRPKEGNETSRLSSPMCVSECLGLQKGHSSSVYSDIPYIQVLPWRRLAPPAAPGLRGLELGRPDTELWEKTRKAFQPIAEDAEAFLGTNRLCEWKHNLDGTDADQICSSPPLDMRDMERVYENLVSAESAGRPCPDGVGLGCRDTLAGLHAVREFLWNYDYENVNAVKAGGMLLGEILETMKRARKWHMPEARQPRNENSKPPAMYLYSGDDTNVAALLASMKAPWFHAPRYGSYVSIELWAPKDR